jgi:hypothetical protein
MVAKNIKFHFFLLFLGNLLFFAVLIKFLLLFLPIIRVLPNEVLDISPFSLIFYFLALFANSKISSFSLK